MTLDTWATTHPDRCSLGFAAAHHPTFCNCSDMGEWVVFTTALRSAARPDGTVHQCDVRPKIRGRIAPKHIGPMWRRARSEGLVRDTGEREPSNDSAGRNTDKLDRIYELRAA